MSAPRVWVCVNCFRPMAPEARKLGLRRHCEFCLFTTEGTEMLFFERLAKILMNISITFAAVSLVTIIVLVAIERNS